MNNFRAHRSTICKRCKTAFIFYCHPEEHRPHECINDPKADEQCNSKIYSMFMQMIFQTLFSRKRKRKSSWH